MAGKWFNLAAICAPLLIIKLYKMDYKPPPKCSWMPIIQYLNEDICSLVKLNMAGVATIYCENIVPLHNHWYVLLLRNWAFISIMFGSLMM